MHLIYPCHEAQCYHNPVPKNTRRPRVCPRLTGHGSVREAPAAGASWAATRERRHAAGESQGPLCSAQAQGTVPEPGVREVKAQGRWDLGIQRDKQSKKTEKDLKWICTSDVIKPRNETTSIKTHQKPQWVQEAADRQTWPASSRAGEGGGRGSPAGSRWLQTPRPRHCLHMYTSLKHTAFSSPGISDWLLEAKREWCPSFTQIC